MKWAESGMHIAQKARINQLIAAVLQCLDASWRRTSNADFFRISSVPAMRNRFRESRGIPRSGVRMARGVVSDGAALLIAGG